MTRFLLGLLFLLGLGPIACTSTSTNAGGATSGGGGSSGAAGGGGSSGAAGAAAGGTSAGGSRTSGNGGSSATGGGGSMGAGGTSGNADTQLVVVPTSHDFGTVSIGDTVEVSLTIVNAGDAGSEPLSIQLDSSVFELADDNCTGNALEPDASCTVSVSFAPDVAGEATADVLVSATNTNSVTVPLSGVGIAPGALELSPSAGDFGEVLLGDAATSLVFTVENTGDAATGQLSTELTGSQADAFQIIDDACDGAALASNESCLVEVAFDPSVAGEFSASLVVGGDPGGFATVQLSGSALVPLSWEISKGAGALGSGNVSLTIDGDAIDCGATCSGVTGYPSGSLVTLEVEPVGDSGYWFTGWGGACSGQLNTCQVTLDQARSVVIQFEPVNFAFISSETFSGALGNGVGVQTYDGHCNRLASAAGLNSGGGDAYIAIMYDATSTPEARLAAARGWVRPDGMPFLDDLPLTDVMSSLTLDETGASVGGVRTHVGSAAQHCTNWTNAAQGDQWGVSGGGPGQWLQGTPTGAGACGIAQRIYCMSTVHSTPLTVARAPGSKLVYLSGNGFAAGVDDPDDYCDSSKPAGTGEVRALLARVGLAAAAFLNANLEYVRPDGVSVGTGAELAAGDVRSGIWQLGDGTYQALGATLPAGFTGASTPQVAGTASTTCDDWTNASGTVARGANWANTLNWWTGATGNCNTQAGTNRMYCVEQ